MTTKVLIVDDAASMRAMISSVVGSLGFDSVMAASGEEALGLFSQQAIDIAVLDVNMEGINGFDTCRMLRKLAANDWFPVIYLSGMDSTENIVEGLDAGGDVFVSKPVNPGVLEATLRAMGRIANMKAELATANAELAKVAAYDGLTQILNRRSFDEYLLRYTLQAKREKTDLVVILLDIDHFKLYNDHYGHIRGDSTLVAFAQVLSDCLKRPVDMAFRYGGEEFAILLPNTDADGAAVIAQRIIDKLAELGMEHEPSLTADHVTASLGVVLSEGGSIEPNALIKKSDEALYKAKEQGRNRFILAD